MARYQYFPEGKWNLYKYTDEMPEDPIRGARLIDTTQEDYSKREMVWNGIFWEFAYLYTTKTDKPFIY